MFIKCYYGEGEFGDQARGIQCEDVNGTDYISHKTETSKPRRQEELRLEEILCEGVD